MTTSTWMDALAVAITQRIGEPRYRLWFDGKTRFQREHDGAIRVGVPNRFFQEWLQKSFAGAVASAVADTLGVVTEIRYLIDPELYQAHRLAQADSTSSHAKPAAAKPAIAVKPSTRRWHPLDEFVVGPCNRLAHAAALNLVEAPAGGHALLTLHGPSGTGKTHLLEGIHGALCQRMGLNDNQVLYVTAEEFTNQFLNGLQQKQSGAFRKRFRDAEALLVDDFHFFAGKQSTQVEFLHTFETLRKQGRPVAVASEAHPKMIGALLPELADRLLAGGVWPLATPDPETRAAILRAKSLRLECPLGDDGIGMLADELRGNVRELEGALNTVHHYHRVHGAPITVDLIREALGDLLKHTSRALQLADIEQALCNVLDVPKKAFHSKDKSRATSYPRMLAIYEARKRTELSYAAIGRYFGGRSHGTAIAAERKVQAWIDRDTPLIVGNRRWRMQELMAAIERELAW